MYEVTWENGKNYGVIRRGPRGRLRTTFETREAAEAAITRWKSMPARQQSAAGVEGTRYEVVPARAKDIRTAESIEEVQALLGAAGNLVQLLDLLEDFDAADLNGKFGDPDFSKLPSWGPRPECPPEGMLSWNKDYALYYDAEDPMGPWFLLPREQMEEKLRQAFRDVAIDMAPPRIYEPNPLADHQEETRMEVTDESAVEVVRNEDGTLKGGWVTARVWVAADELDLTSDGEGGE